MGSRCGSFRRRGIPATGYYDDLLNSSNGNPTRDNTGVGRPHAGKQVHVRGGDARNFDVNKPMTSRCTGSGHGRLPREVVLRERVHGLRPGDGRRGDDRGPSTTAKCNACHDPVVGHGSNYREAKTCALCHNPKDMVGNLQEFDMGIWHRIHSSNLEDVGEITYPNYYLQNCEACHTPTAAQGMVYLTKPGANSCGGCHADIDFAAGVRHPPRPTTPPREPPPVPDSGQEFDASIKGAHTLPLESKSLKGLKAEILSVDEYRVRPEPDRHLQAVRQHRQPLDPKPFGTKRQRPRGRTDRRHATWPMPRERVSTATRRHLLRLHDEVGPPLRPSRLAHLPRWMSAAPASRSTASRSTKAPSTPSTTPRSRATSSRPPERRQPGQCLACHDWLRPRRARLRGGRVPSLPNPTSDDSRPDLPPGPSPSRSRWRA
ncbi:MAG: hypothetical protein IPF66_24170 [Holophagales bacterium]|nr:hypothetical protein [Holophagales bacterium]